MSFCSKCGRKVKADSCYCTGCGQPQVEPSTISAENDQLFVIKGIKPKNKKIFLLIASVMLILASLFAIDYYAFNFTPVTKTIDWDIDGVMYGKYSGIVQNRHPHGKGKFIVTTGLAIGSEYIGDWLNGRRHGFGTMTTPDGDSVTGDWEQGSLIYGTYFYANGSTYKGQFKCGARHGEGILTAPDGSKYQGQWKEGYPHGQGSWTTRDAKYVGGYQNGLWHGQGTMTFYDGTVLSGVWINGEFTGIYPDKPLPQLRDWGN